MNFDVIMSAQTKNVFEFFNIPIGFISRIEQSYHIPVEAAKKSANTFASQPNYIEIQTKDGRGFKFTFGLAEFEDCAKVHKVLENTAFLDKDGRPYIPRLKHSFPF